MWNETLFLLGRTVIAPGHLLLAGAALLGLILLLAARSGRRRAAEEAAYREDANAARMEAVLRTQAELAGRVKAIGDVFGERLESMSNRLGHTLDGTRRQTSEDLSKLAERLAVIDAAQKNMADLTGQVVTLQEILSNKQTRGAFGQVRMEAIVMDGLPSSIYEFQATLSHNRRPDCLVRLPGEAGAIVIDAKFPLEAFNAIRAADTPDARKLAAARFRQDVSRHIADIAERYLIPGETLDTALMFVPSEAICAELHEAFDDVVQRAYRARVVIVSPTLLMLSVQVVQVMLRDHRMREQAHVVRREVGHLLDDVRRLDERVRALKRHFGQAGDDIDQILVSSAKIGRRSERIGALETDEADSIPSPVPGLAASTPSPHWGEGRDEGGRAVEMADAGSPSLALADGLLSARDR